MVFPVIGGDGKPTGYEIENSLRFNDDDSPNVSNNPNAGSGSDGSRTQFSISMWVKRSRVSGTQQFLTSAVATNTFYGTIKFNGDNKIQVNLINSGSDQDEIVTDAVYRDVSAWYHLFFVFDKTQAALSNGIKLYVNGVLQTWGTTTYAQNEGYHFFRPGKTHYIGNYNGQEGYFDGYMAEVHFVDGQLKAHTDFGETDDNGVWIPKEYDGTHGTYGFYLEFKQTGTSENSSGIGADTSGNDEHFAVANLAATDVTVDTPTNNFATLNPLAPINGGAPSTLPTFSEGSTQITVGDGTTRFATGTFATSMPYYFEVKVSAISGSDSDQRIGIIDGDAISTSTTYNSVYQGGGVITATGESNATGKDTLTANDIIGVAVDLATNNNIKFYENGDLQATMSVGASYQGLTSTPFARLVNATTTFQFNFGNPSFAISSGNADANGYGNFEYAVPSGYYSLCTKNLATYG